MTETIETDICVIGAGSAGLSVAAGAAQMGAATVLIEAGEMGGDCLNTGCVPSKALLAAAHRAAVMRGSAPFGLEAMEPRIDFQAIHDHVHGVIAAIAPHDSVERFEGFGVRVIRDWASFTGPQEIAVGDKRVKARRIVIATGSQPSAPPIEGLEQAGHLTNETIFELTECPDHLIIIGGGPIGCEMAQAHRRLGARVTIVEAFSILGKDDPDLAAIVKAALSEDGVALHEGVEIARVDRGSDGVRVVIAGDGAEHTIVGSHLLVAAGRRPSVERLNLEAAGVDYTEKGVTVDAGLRTTNKKVYAIGDVAGGPQFTHVAGYHASLVIRSALFRLPAKVDYRALPWVTYTDPELAQVGLTEAQAKEAHEDARVLCWKFDENDRAQTERATEGRIKVITTKRGRVLGATIVGAHAGEQIHVWGLAIAQKLKISAVASMIAPYPTLGEAGKRAAGAFYTPMLFSPRTRRIVRFLARFG